MAHNTRVFDPPVVFAQTIGPAELNALDVLVSESVNGDQGGVWACVTPIIIGGAGLQVTGAFSASAYSITTPLTVTRSEGATVLGFNATNWQISGDGDIMSLGTTAATFGIPLTPPHGSTLNGVSVTLIGAGGHAALPANMPQIQVKRTNLTTGATDLIGVAAVDSSASVVAYQTTHTIATGVLASVVDRATYRYHVEFTNEWGANALSGLVYRGVRRTCIVSSVDVGD